MFRWRRAACWSALLWASVKVGQTHDMRAKNGTSNELNTEQQNKLRDLSPHANYTDRAAAAGRRS